MDKVKYQYSVFTKRWKMPARQLGMFVHDLGFDGIELPVRPGYQVEPENVARDLPIVAKQLVECGVCIYSVAGPVDEATIAACGEVGVPVIRVMVSVRDNAYLAAIERVKREYDALVPLLDRCGVTIGVQNHCGNFVTSAVGLREIVAQYDPKHVAAVWDVAHCALDGELPGLALDILWSHLCMVNLKNPVWQRTNGPEAESAEWKVYWTSGRQGLASWPNVAREIQNRDWQGVLCLTAEYSDHSSVDRLIAEDIAFAKSLFV